MNTIPQKLKNVKKQSSCVYTNYINRANLTDIRAPEKEEYYYTIISNIFRL
jgi:hypothetical protein